MTPLWNLAGVVLLFGLTIFVHELGHFLVARLCGLKAEVFSIGFGPALWKRTVRGVLYKVGVLPFGGYVALPQLDPTGGLLAAGEDGKPKYPPAAPGRKILVSLAGAVFNLGLAVLLSWVIFWTGKPSAPHERRCVAGFVAEDGPAWAAGLRPGDEILSADGERVGHWQDLLTVLTLSGGPSVALRVRSPSGEERAMSLPTESTRTGVRRLRGVEWEEICRVGALVPGGAAGAAGMKPGDRILEFDGAPVYSPRHLAERIHRAGGREAPIRVQRGTGLLDLSVLPRFDPSHGRHMIGIEFSLLAVDFDLITRPRPMAQMREHAGGILRFLRALATPRRARQAAGAVGGPVAIFRGYWTMMDSSLVMALWFTAFLNVNLAILNLLPLPVLDGGHILFSAVEGLTRRPAHPGFVQWSYRVTATLLIALFLLVTVRDSRRWIGPLPRPGRPPSPPAAEPGSR